MRLNAATAQITTEIRIDKGHEGLAGFGGVLHIVEGIIVILALPLTAALLNQPQTNDVFKEACFAVYAALVCDVYVKRS